MSHSNHEKAYFYKYATCDTALKVIASKSFRWSSPTKFNDPFDHQAGFVWPGDDKDFAIELAVSLERVIYDDPVVVDNGLDGLAEFIRDARALRKNLPRSAFSSLMRSTAIEMSKAYKQMLPEFNQQILEHLSHSRVFCITERNDNLVMWSHYAEEHKGVVFKLKCDEDIGNALLIAAPVIYTDEFIPFPKSAEYARYLTGEGSLDFPPLVRKIAQSKHSDWAYEKEWRVNIPLLDNERGDGYSMYVEDAAIFDSVYLGCRMPPDDVSKVASAIRAHLPQTKMFLAKMNTSSFGLTFDEFALR